MSIDLTDGLALILVVDDAEENRELLSVVLEEERYRVCTARTGRDALEQAFEMSPDLILLDVNMPVMNGFDACARLKSEERTRDIPVMFLTAQGGLDDIVHGFELGAVDYLTKPFNIVELLVRVKTHIQLRRARQRLADLTEKLAKYLSPQVYASIFRGEKAVRIESHQKVLTVCFADIVNFTPKAEILPPDRLTAWLNHYLNEMAQIVMRYGGTLDKYIGDAVMVFFGDPTSMGARQDAIQCVRMALDMLKHAETLGIDIRVGISTVECTVGNFGSNHRMDYTIIGREVNVASRLEGVAGTGRILISESTYQMVKDEILCEPRGNVQVKGLECSLMTYWVRV